MWMLWVVCCGGCWIGAVFVPFGQRHLSLFLASFNLYTNSRSFSYLNKVGLVAVSSFTAPTCCAISTKHARANMVGFSDGGEIEMS